MKLSSLIIKNFGCFDETGCEIKIDNIVVLIGQNNTGKSTILDAYEAFSTAGAELKTSNFHNENIDNPIEITGVFTEIEKEDINVLGGKCVHLDEIYGECIKVMFRWTEPNKKGEKYTFSSETGFFEKGGAGGWDSLIASRIPVPLRIKPTDKHDVIETAIIDILTSTVKESIKNDQTKIAKVIEELKTLTADFALEIEAELQEATSSISEKLKDIFPNHEAEFFAEVGKFETEKVIGSGSHIRIKNHLNSLPLNQQGSGLQRAFLWAAIASLAEIGKIKKGAKKIDTSDRSRILLIDEPEAFLHPPTIRSAREALYTLAELENWQVMASTHSPIFIDVSKPHTTIMRVEKDNASTKLISTDSLSFEEDRRLELAMIRNCNPMVNEFFFAEKVLLVEGDTEQLVYMTLMETTELKGKLHIVNCYGKANIPTFCKILNHFGVPYVAIHDSDSPKSKRKDKFVTNSMWTINQKILDLVLENKYGSIALVQVPNFEGYYFSDEIKYDKPYAAYQILQSEEFHKEEKYAILRDFYKSLEDGSHMGIYKDVDQLNSLIISYINENKPDIPELWEF